MELMFIIREKLSWQALAKLGGADPGSTIAAASLSERLRSWKFDSMEGHGSSNDLVQWKKSIERLFKILMGMYTLVDRRLEFMEKERDDIAKMVDQKLELMQVRMERRLLSMETKILPLKTKDSELGVGSEEKEAHGFSNPTRNP